MTLPQFPYLSQHEWRYFDDANHDPALAASDSLAYQDSFIRWLPHLQGDQPQGLVHFYSIDRPTVLLGAKDSRLPNLAAGLAYLEEQGFDYALRPHGGLGVVCDPGILNIGLASDLTHFPLSIDAAYEQMVALIGLSLMPYGLKLEAYEIAQSYCPGTYDLVVGGQKIGGIAQRRFKTGLTTAAYISVAGDQAARAQLMAGFYQAAGADDSYPKVDPTVMTTLAHACGQPLDRRTYQEELSS